MFNFLKRKRKKKEINDKADNKMNIRKEVNELPEDIDIKGIRVFFKENAQNVTKE